MPTFTSSKHSPTQPHARSRSPQYQRWKGDLCVHYWHTEVKFRQLTAGTTGPQWVRHAACRWFCGSPSRTFHHEKDKRFTPETLTHPGWTFIHNSSTSPDICDTSGDLVSSGTSKSGSWWFFSCLVKEMKRRKSSLPLLGDRRPTCVNQGLLWHLCAGRSTSHRGCWGTDGSAGVVMPPHQAHSSAPCKHPLEYILFHTLNTNTHA